MADSIPVVSDAAERALAQQPQTLTEAQAALDATPNFNSLFRAKLLRRAFKGTKRRRATAHPVPQQELRDLIAKKVIKERRCCKSKWCFVRNGSDLSKFFAQAAKWRVHWKLTPRHAKHNALLQHLNDLKSRSRRSQRSAQSQLSQQSQSSIGGGGDVSRCAGREVICLPPPQDIQYDFLGHHMCKRAFETVAGVNVSRGRKLMRQGLQTWERQTRVAKKVKLDQMIAAIWMFIQQLHHQSPYAKDVVEGVWHIPFHQKVCLWRLIEKANHDRPSDAAPLFTSTPKYWTFRKAVRREEFAKVVFHRIVDIGRCSKCEFFKWKCASVPLWARPIWQDALAKHHLLQIQQKQCYAQDRARAAADFPMTELYLAPTT